MAAITIERDYGRFARGFNGGGAEASSGAASLVGGSLYGLEACSCKGTSGLGALSPVAMAYIAGAVGVAGGYYLSKYLLKRGRR